MISYPLVYRNRVKYHINMRNEKGQFLKGLVPWNKDTKGVMKANKGSFQKGYGAIDLEIRFWEKVNRTDTCWLWKAYKNNTGYGMINVNGKIKLAHRISYEFSFGEIPKGLGVLHKCDIPLCVNPSHLFLGSQKDNAIDMVNKKRDCGGERAPWAKLKQKNVDKIRKLYSFQKMSQRLLAKDFNVSQSTINLIINKKTWK